MQETKIEKLLTSWYRVSTDLARIYPSPMCAGGDVEAGGTLLHLWWECPWVDAYWQEVRDLVKDILELDVPFSSVHFLLHISPMSAATKRARCPIY